MKNFRELLMLAIFAFVLSACSLMTTPAGLDISTTRISDEGRYQVSVKPLPSYVKINQLHSWEIELKTAAGAPVPHAQISFEGGMPQHHHGYPTKPRITEELQAGRYRLDGVKFSMTGWWNMKFKIQAEPGNDQITFNTVVTPNGVAKSAAEFQ